MNESEDVMSGINVYHNETSSEPKNGQTRTSSGQEYYGDRGNSSNNNGDSAASTNKDYKA